MLNARLAKDLNIEKSVYAKYSRNAALGNGSNSDAGKHWSSGSWGAYAKFRSQLSGSGSGHGEGGLNAVSTGGIINGGASGTLGMNAPSGTSGQSVGASYMSSLKGRRMKSGPRNGVANNSSANASGLMIKRRAKNAP